MESGQTPGIRVTDLPAGRYAAYVNCGALLVEKGNVDRDRQARRVAAYEVVAPPAASGLSLPLGVFGSA